MTMIVWVLLCAIFAFSFAFVEGSPNTKGTRRCPPLQQDEDAGKPLFLTPFIENGCIDQARGKAVVQHNEMGNVSSYAGLLTVNKEYNSNMFFWFFPAMNNPRTAPVVLWLHGGPGVSSLFALFLENGPFRVNVNKTLSMKEFSWSISHNLLYIDNPIGSGYSFTENDKGYATSDADVGRDINIALVQFFKLFPELQANDFFVTGESYAGKFVPAVSYAIKNYNINAETKINLKGLAIGSGFTDPINQLSYGPFLYQIGLVDFNGRDLLDKYEEECRELIQQNKYNEAYDKLVEMIGGEELTGPSVVQNLTGYEYLFNFLFAKEPSESLAETIRVVEWVNRTDVRNAIHVGSTTFNGLNTLVARYLKSDGLRSVAPLMCDLAQHYRILLYSGQLDIVVAYPFTENYLLKLQWPGAEKYKTAPRKLWYYKGELAGYTKTADNLTEALIRNAGHLVSTDKPEWALDLLTRFTHNQPL